MRGTLREILRYCTRFVNVRGYFVGRIASPEEMEKADSKRNFQEVEDFVRCRNIVQSEPAGTAYFYTLDELHTYIRSGRVSIERFTLQIVPFIGIAKGRRGAVWRLGSGAYLPKYSREDGKVGGWRKNPYGFSKRFRRNTKSFAEQASNRRFMQIRRGCMAQMLKNGRLKICESVPAAIERLFGAISRLLPILDSLDRGDSAMDLRTLSIDITSSRYSGIDVLASSPSSALIASTSFADGNTTKMDTSPTLSIGGSRARAALLTTSGTGSGGTDRRVVFLTSQTVDGSGHETKTWPHHWSPHTLDELGSPRSTYVEIEIGDALVETF
uniref:Uncharacterized protein n=1 Tax=Vespula pensylvanica TaxID=30213 RepID=A0A834JZ62_VESPE|nr:hypothetical protein H0235_016387 [Vespula pensylvanica]